MTTSEFLAALCARFPKSEAEIMSWRDNYDRMLRPLSPADVAKTLRVTLDSWNNGYFPRPAQFALNRPGSNAKDKERGFTDEELAAWKNQTGALMDETLKHYADEIAAEPSPEFLSCIVHQIERLSFRAGQERPSPYFIDLHALSERDMLTPWQKAVGHAQTRERTRRMAAAWRNAEESERRTDRTREQRREVSVDRAQFDGYQPEADA